MTENICKIPQARCAVVFPQKGRGRRPIRKEGTVVGAYYRPYWHPHMYHAYHIVFDDGTCDTLNWKQVAFI